MSFVCGNAFGTRDFVAMRVAREKPIAGPAEPLPDRFRAGSLDRSDDAPLGLQPLELCRRLIPFG